MSEIKKHVELSVQELDNVAGGAVSNIDAEADVLKDQQFSATDVSAYGDIKNINAQSTEKVETDLLQFNATGEPPVKK